LAGFGQRLWRPDESHDVNEATAAPRVGRKCCSRSHLKLCLSRSRGCRARKAGFCHRAVFGNDDSVLGHSRIAIRDAREGDCSAQHFRKDLGGALGIFFRREDHLRLNRKASIPVAKDRNDAEFRYSCHDGALSIERRRRVSNATCKEGLRFQARREVGRSEERVPNGPHPSLGVDKCVSRYTWRASPEGSQKRHGEQGGPACFHGRNTRPRRASPRLRARRQRICPAEF